MPTLNSRGDSLSAHGAINGVVPNALSGGGQVTCAAWLDDDSVVAQIEDPVARLVVYELGMPTMQALDDAGANRVVAGAGSWLAQLTRRDKTTYTRGHLSGFTGFHEEDFRVCDIDPSTGWFVGCDYSTGERLRVYNVDGDQPVRVSTTGAVRDYTPRLRDGYLGWVDDGGPHLSIWDGSRFAEMTLAPRRERVYLVVPVSTPGGIFVLELTDTRLTLREPRETGGWVLSAIGETTFNPDARVVRGEPFATFAAHDGEGDREWRSGTVSLTATFTDLNAPLPVMVPRINRPCVAAIYDGFGVADAPCNTDICGMGEWPVNRTRSVIAVPGWATRLYMAGYDVNGVFVSNDGPQLTDAELEVVVRAAEVEARSLKCALLFYDERDYRGYLPRGIVVVLRDGGTTGHAFDAAGGLINSISVHTQAQTEDDAIREMVLATDVLRDERRDLGYFLFTYHRSTFGLDAHPRVLEAARQLLAGVTGNARLPVLPPIITPPLPPTPPVHPVPPPAPPPPPARPVESSDNMPLPTVGKTIQFRSLQATPATPYNTGVLVANNDAGFLAIKSGNKYAHFHTESGAFLGFTSDSPAGEERIKYIDSANVFVAGFPDVNGPGRTGHESVSLS